MNSQNNWKQDPRLRQMNKEKLDYILKFAEQMNTMSKDQIVPAFTAMQLDSRKKGIQFNNQESDLLMSILSTNMSPEEKKRMESIRALAQKMAGRNS